MRENEPRMHKGNVEILRGSGGPHSHAKLPIAVRIAVVLLTLFTSISLDTAASAGVPDLVRPSTLEVWPAGTHLFIPDRVIQNYRKKTSSWSRPSSYLFANYFFTGPSFPDRRKDTFYVPLVNKQTGNMEHREVWMDIMNISRVRDNDIAFVIISDIYIVDMASNGKGLYFGVKMDK